MPPKGGLLAALSVIALGVGVSLTASEAKAQAQLIELCSWIDKTDSIADLQAKINDLRLVNPADPCIELAAAKIVQLTAPPAAGPIAKKPAYSG